MRAEWRPLDPLVLVTFSGLLCWGAATGAITDATVLPRDRSDAPWNKYVRYHTNGPLRRGRQGGLSLQWQQRAERGAPDAATTRDKKRAATKTSSAEAVAAGPAAGTSRGDASRKAERQARVTLSGAVPVPGG